MQKQHAMTTYQDLGTLLKDLENNIETIDGLIVDNAMRYAIDRKINGKFETIVLSQYRNSEDLILVETNEYAFTVSRWNETCKWIGLL